MLFDLPAALTLRYIKPRFVIGTALVIFGTLAALLAVVKSYAAIMVIRVGIGLGECFVNVAWIFASQWYRPSEMGLRAGTWCSRFRGVHVHSLIKLFGQDCCTV